MCFGCSKEPSHGDGSFEYPQHTFLLRNKKNNFQLRTLIWGPELRFLGKTCSTAYLVSISSVGRKPVFEIQDQVKLKLACSATETS